MVEVEVLVKVVFCNLISSILGFIYQSYNLSLCFNFTKERDLSIVTVLDQEDICGSRVGYARNYAAFTPDLL